MTKREIENRALAGLPLYGSDIARVRRDARVITLRHVWGERVDGRALDGVRRAYRTLARALARRTGRSVEVYASQGFMLDQIDPE